MRLKFYFLQIAFALAAPLAWSQGTFVYDQQSSTDETTPVTGQGASLLNHVLGQSFTPSLDAVGFIRLMLDDPNPGTGGAATLQINLMAGSINGTLLASTEPVYLIDGSAGTFDFFFAAPVAVTPGVQYFFAPVELPSSKPFNIDVQDYFYPGGSLYVDGAVGNPAVSLWFREGTGVPEPSSWVLLLLGGGVLALFRRVKTQLNTSTGP